MSLNKFSWREVRARPTRIALTFLSITIGVGAVVAVFLATSTTRRAQSEMLKAVSGRADLEILTNSAQGFSDDLLKQVREMDGVEVAIPSINRFATLFAPNGKKARTQILGVDPRIDHEIRDYEIVEGEQPKVLNEILLDSSFAEALGVQVGQDLKLLGSGGLQELKLVGLVRPGGSAALSLGGATYLVLPTAQRIFRSNRKLDQILVLVTPTADANDILRKLKSTLPENVTARIPRTRSNMAQEAMYATENGLHMAIAFALLIAAFIIYNTFEMAVSERRRQLGILRAIGATRRQVSRMIMKEALWISVAGSLAGCVLGYFGADLLNQTTEQMLRVELPSVHLSVLPFVLATVLGIVVAQIGAFLPARRASSVQPVEAMRAVEAQHNDDIIQRTRSFGFVAIPSGLLLLYLTIRGGFPVGTDIVAIVLVLLGCVLLIPVLLESGSSALVKLLNPWLGIEARLAQKQLMRHVGRSTLTIGVLFIAVSTSIGMAGNILDNVENVRAWYSRAFIGDFFIRASMPDFATGAAADMPDGIQEKLLAIDGTTEIEPLRLVSSMSGEDSILVVGRNFTKEPEDYFDLVVARDKKTIEHLNEGQVVIGSVLAERLNLQPGDTIPLETETGTLDLPITATTNDYLAGGLTVYLTMQKAAELLNADGASVYVVTAEKDQINSVKNQLQQLCSDEGLILQSYAELVSFIDNMMNGVIASLWMLLALGCSIAAMGLVNTLTMNILEQTREIGMLRVVAMTRRQVRRMIFSQALLMGAIGIMPGALAGIFVSYSISQSAMAVLGHNIIYHSRPGLILGCAAFGMLVVLLASLIPAERASRLKLSAALQYE